MALAVSVLLPAPLRASPDADWSPFFDASRPQRAAVIEAPSRRTLPSPARLAQRRRMLANLAFIESAFKAQYAPGAWKQTHNGWDLDGDVARARTVVESRDDLSLRDYQKLVRGIFLSAKDYHVSVGFHSTESSSLPFTVAEAQGRYFLSWVDRSKLPEASFPFKPGDELVGFDGKKTSDVVDALRAHVSNNAALTDRALAAIALTSRRGSRLDDTVRGPVTISVLPKGAPRPLSRQLIWDYAPEQILPQPGLLSFKPSSVDALGRTTNPLPWPDDARLPNAELYAPGAGNPFALGQRESYLPPLGDKLWESDPSDTFHAYLYRMQPGNRLIGYVRIPSYGASDAGKQLDNFAKVIQRFEPITDALVIDQLNNPGGSVFYLYALASMLSDQPLAAPRHHIAITQEDVASAAGFLSHEPEVKTDADAKRVLGQTLGGYPVDYEVFRHLMDFSRFIIAEWNAGRTLTEPVWLWGMDHLNPSPAAHYTKPSRILVNELDFPGRGFFQGDPQGHKRATLFGTRTAGAGGFIRGVSYPNRVGLSGFSLTGSIAERADSNPIENLGVKPDIAYAVTPADLQDGFKDYVKAVNQAVTGLLAAR